MCVVSVVVCKIFSIINDVVICVDSVVVGVIISVANDE